MLCESATECWDTQEAGFIEVRFTLVLDKQGLTSLGRGEEYSTRREQHEQMHGGRKEYLEYWLCARAWQACSWLMKALSARLSISDVNSSKGFRWGSDMIRSGF